MKYKGLFSAKNSNQVNPLNKHMAFINGTSETVISAFRFPSDSDRLGGVAADSRITILPMVFKHPTMLSLCCDKQIQK